jgi:hypothetical protein
MQRRRPPPPPGPPDSHGPSAAPQGSPGLGFVCSSRSVAWAVWLRLRPALRERARQVAHSGPGTHGASVDLDVPLSPPFYHESNGLRTHTKPSYGLLDSDTLTKATFIGANQRFRSNQVQVQPNLEPTHPPPPHPHPPPEQAVRDPISGEWPSITPYRM